VQPAWRHARLHQRAVRRRQGRRAAGEDLRPSGARWPRCSPSTATG
jgi:hypothetical protein